MIHWAKRVCSWRCAWRFAQFALVSLGLLYVSSNIILNSPWAKGVIGKKLELRTGLEWKIGTATWYPSGNVRLLNLRASLGDGEVSIERLTTTLRFTDLLSPGRGIEVIEAKHLELDVSVEHLAKWVHKVESPGADPVSAPVAVAGTPSSGPIDNKGAVASVDKDKQQPSRQVSPALAPPTRVDPSVASAAVSHPKQVAPAPAAIPAQPAPPQELPTVWLRLQDASLKIRDGAEVLAEVRGVNMQIPIGANEETGHISWPDIRVGGETFIKAGEVKIETQKHILQIREGEIVAAGIHLQPRIKLKPAGTSILFQASAVVPEQSFVCQREVDNMDVSLAVESMMGIFAVEGNLLDPRSWFGGGKYLAKGVAVREGHRGGSIVFSTIQMLMQVRQGAFIVPDFKATADDAVIMGNGVLLPNGYSYGIMRLVVSPEKDIWITRVYNGAHIAEKGDKHCILAPLVTRDRFYGDIRLDGPVFNPDVQFTPGGRWMPLGQVIKKMHQFIREERAEDRHSGQITKDQQ